MSATTALTGARLLDDLADAGDHVVEALADRAQGDDRGDEVVDERQHDQQDGDDEENRGGGHQAVTASSTMMSSEPP